MTGPNQNGDSMKEELNSAAFASHTDAPAGTENPVIPAKGKGKDRGQIGVVILIVVAVTASIVMIVSDSQAAQRIAMLAALWAAVVGLFLVTRYRRQVQQREEELVLQEDFYLSEIDRFRADHADLDRDADLLADIKSQLATIREQLEELSGREFLYEPAALQAEARRIQQLEERAHSALHEESPNAGDAAESTVNFTQTSSGRPSADAIAGRVGNVPASPRQDNPLTELINERQSTLRMATAASPSEPTPVEPKPFNTGSFQAVRWDTGRTAEKPDSTPDVAGSTATAHKAPEVPMERATPGQHEAGEGRRGRRRSDAHRAGSVSVAELLAAANKDNKKNKSSK